MARPNGVPDVVYVAEAFKDGERIERIVHVIEEDAWEDIRVMTDERQPDRIDVSPEKLYTGQLAREA